MTNILSLQTYSVARATVRRVLLAATFVWLCGVLTSFANAQSPSAAATPPPPPRLTIPDVTILDQDGRTKSFYTDLIKNKVVAINFVFTTCTTSCSALTRRFEQVQNLLGDRLGRDVFLISVSTDPTIDTPARLREYGERYRRRNGWTFVTGSPAQVNQVLLALQGSTARQGRHSALVLMNHDVRGKWKSYYALTPAAGLAQALNNW